MAFRKSGAGLASVLGVVLMALAWAQVPSSSVGQTEGKTAQAGKTPQAGKTAQAGKTGKATGKIAQPAPAQAKRELRHAPTLAILMVAYEGVQQNNDKANPELVRAMKQSFEKNPSARQTMAKIHTAYRALPPADREKIVGKELAQATGSTRLTKALVEPLLRKQFQLKAPMLAEKMRATVDPAAMKPVIDSDKDQESTAPEKMVPMRERLIGAEVKEGSSTRYRVEYKGLYCRREPRDWGSHCEPYVICVMKQGDSQWTRRKGPYERCDSGDKFRDTMTLRSNTPFGNDLDVVATTFEHDLGNIEEIEDAIQTGVDTLAGVVGIWWDVPNWLKDAVTDVLTWFADLFGLADDQIGEPQAIRFTRSYAQNHTGHHTWEGFTYDTFLRSTGGRGDFYIFLDVRQLPE